MPGLRKLAADRMLSDFSAKEFSERARIRGIELGMSSWMAEQPLSYGIDAGRRLDRNGNGNENLRLEHLIQPNGWRMAAVLVPVVAREPEGTAAGPGAEAELVAALVRGGLDLCAGEALPLSARRWPRDRTPDPRPCRQRCRDAGWDVVT